MMMKFVGSSASAIFATTRPDIGNAEMPQAPIIGLIFFFTTRFTALANSTPPAVSKMKATRPSPSTIPTSTIRNFSADIVEPIVIPSSNVTRLASSFWAELDSRSTTPLTLIRLPNIRLPIKATEIGAIMPAISVIIIGNSTSAVLDTGSCSSYSIRISRSSLVVSSLITGGWMIGTSAM